MPSLDRKICVKVFADFILLVAGIVYMNIFILIIWKFLKANKPKEKICV